MLRVAGKASVRRRVSRAAVKPFIPWAGSAPTCSLVATTRLPAFVLQLGAPESFTALRLLSTDLKGTFAEMIPAEQASLPLQRLLLVTNRALLLRNN